ncbi:MAG: DMT family transporter [Melioribacteraceae bacterium]|nr:DMT family transporter [Melioribacteraceae bacterium]
MNNSSINAFRKRFKGEIALLIITVIWGATFPIIKESLNDSTPFIFVAVRFSIASILILPFFLPKVKLLNKETLKAGLVLGVLMFGGFVTQTIGLNHTTATKSGFITGSVVVMIPFLQFYMEKKIPTKGAIFGTILVFIGLLFLSSGGNDLISFITDLGGSFNFGDFMTLVCAIIFAHYVVFIDIYTNKYEFIFLFSLQIFTTAILGILSASFIGISDFGEIRFVLTESLIFGLLYTGILATVVNIGIQTKFQKLITPTKAGIIYSFEPIFAAVFAFFLLNEKISNFGFIGMGLIFFGLISSEIYDTLFNKNGKENS